jgi:hypothetical protein
MPEDSHSRRHAAIETVSAPDGASARHDDGLVGNAPPMAAAHLLISRPETARLAVVLLGPRQVDDPPRSVAAGETRTSQARRCHRAADEPLELL